jgi:hypothetical protein
MQYANSSAPIVLPQHFTVLSLSQVWPQYAQVKSAYFKASANHSTATVLHSKDQYGDEVQPIPTPAKPSIMHHSSCLHVRLTMCYGVGGPAANGRQHPCVRRSLLAASSCGH